MGWDLLLGSDGQRGDTFFGVGKVFVRYKAACRLAEKAFFYDSRVCFELLDEHVTSARLVGLDAIVDKQLLSVTDQ